MTDVVLANPGVSKTRKRSSTASQLVPERVGCGRRDWCDRRDCCDRRDWCDRRSSERGNSFRTDLAVVEGRGARPQGSGGEQLVPRTSWRWSKGGCATTSALTGEQLVPRTSRRWSWSKASSASRGFVQHAPGRVQQRVDVSATVWAYSATCRRVRQRIGVFPDVWASQKEFWGSRDFGTRAVSGRRRSRRAFRGRRRIRRGSLRIGRG